MTQIVKINAAEFGLEEQTAATIAAQFKPMLEKMEALEDEFNRIVSLPIDSPETAEQAKKLRLQYVKVRTGTAEIHKNQKAFYLAGGRYVDGWKNAQAFASHGKEEKLESIEKHFENLEKEKKARIKAEREDIAKPYGVDIVNIDLGSMQQEAFDLFIEGAKRAHEARIEAAKKAEEERIAREKAEAEERERIRLENERLKKEAAQREEQMRKEREAAEAKLRAEREAADKERKRMEAEAAKQRAAEELKRKKEREEAEAKAAEERAAREKAEAALREKEEAERKAEAERLAALEAEAKKGDAAKVKDLIADLQAISNKYTFKSKANQKMYADVQVLIGKIVSHIQK